MRVRIENAPGTLQAARPPKSGVCPTSFRLWSSAGRIRRRGVPKTTKRSHETPQEGWGIEEERERGTGNTERTVLGGDRGDTEKCFLFFTPPLPFLIITKVYG